MNNFKATLLESIENDDFLVKIIYKPLENGETDFKFGNSSKTLERDSLEFLDSDLNSLQPINYKIINPKEIKKLKMKISNEYPFIYEVKGKINYYDQKVHIKLATAEYLLERGKDYFLQLRYDGKISEKIKIAF